MSRPARITAALSFAALAAACVTSAAEPPATDACRAGAYQSLVGRLRSEIPEAPAGAVWRIACTTCPVTMDFNPERLNILFDEASGVIKQVKCG